MAPLKSVFRVKGYLFQTNRFPGTGGTRDFEPLGGPRRIATIGLRHTVHRNNALPCDGGCRRARRANLSL